MRTTVVGAHGQLGGELLALLDGPVAAFGRDAVDIANLASVRQALQVAAPELVINTAAYNFVDKAEDEPEVAYSVNALGPRNLALVCAELGVRLVHVSTDYVYGLESGRTAAYTEDDSPGPVSSYGTSKLAGEYYVRTHCPQHYVLRTCGLYGNRAAGQGKGNFVKKMLQLGREREELTVVDDQWCTPTSTLDLARAIVALVQTSHFGLYHATNSGRTTWCGFAREIFRLTGLTTRVRAIASSEFRAKARRPPFSVLDSGRLANAIGREMPSWPAALAEFLAGSAN